MEHGGHRDPQRRPAGDVEDGACVHQGADAPGRRHLRRGDECAPLLPRLRLLRQRDDPWLLVAELLCLKNSSLKSLVEDRQAAFPASGEINRKLGNAAEAIARIRAQYEPAAAHIDTTDGISIEYLSGALTCARPIPSRWCV